MVVVENVSQTISGLENRQTWVMGWLAVGFREKLRMLEESARYSVDGDERDTEARWPASR